MKINIVQIVSYTRLFVRLCLPTTVFIGLCAGIFVAFGAVLRTFSLTVPLFVIGGVWLLLLIFYIILGVTFTHFVARFIRGSFGSEELRVRRRMAALSGFPFYVLCLLCLMATIVCFLFPDMVNGVTGFASEVGFLGFALVSCSYLILMRFFLGSSSAIAHQ